MVCIRPYISHAMGIVSRYMNNPSKYHWEAVKWILRYLRGTYIHALCFGGSNIVLHGYVDSNMVGDKDSRRSTTRYVFTVGGRNVSWISKMKKVVALSTTEVEYVVATYASKEMIWLQRFMEELGRRRRIAGCTMTTRVTFILKRTQPSILILIIYKSGTISYGPFWKMDN
jgi:hypothetical protein